MKISIQILHDFTDDTLKVICQALHLTLQDDLLLEIDLRTVLEFVTIKLETKLKTENQLCFFELNIDTTIYDLSRYEDFVEGFKNKLKGKEGFVKLLIYIDEIRTEKYLTYYKEISELEMNIREVFSFIFYNKYITDNFDLLEDYEIKWPGDRPKEAELEIRNENPFFYLTFNGYYQFERPKEVAVKDIVPLIQTSEQYDHLRTYLNGRGIKNERHIDFLQKVKEKLDSIEKVRNCIAHNRAIPTKAEANYIKTKDELVRFIEDFWKFEIEEVEQVNEISFTEEYSYERINDLLSVAEWNEYNNEVVIHDNLATGTSSHIFNSLDGLKEYLIVEADGAAQANFPSNEDDRATYKQLYNGSSLVDKVLRNYKKELIILNWL